MSNQCSLYDRFTYCVSRIAILHISSKDNNIGLTDVRFKRGSYAWFEKGHFFTKETSVSGQIL